MLRSHFTCSLNISRSIFMHRSATCTSSRFLMVAAASPVMTDIRTLCFRWGTKGHSQESWRKHAFHSQHYRVTTCTININLCAKHAGNCIISPSDQPHDITFMPANREEWVGPEQWQKNKQKVCLRDSAQAGHQNSDHCSDHGSYHATLPKWHQFHGFRLKYTAP